MVFFTISEADNVAYLVNILFKAIEVFFQLNSGTETEKTTIFILLFIVQFLGRVMLDMLFYRLFKRINTNFDIFELM